MMSVIDKVVEIKCTGADYVDIDEIKEFQGDLKSLDEDNYHKLKNIILKHGFSEPISVWQDQDVNRCLNGHQRLTVLKGLRAEGYFVPKIPVSYIQAENEKQAKEKVLTLTSQYGKIEQEGLYQFLQVSEINLDFIHDYTRLLEVNLKELGKDISGASTEGQDDLPTKVDARTKHGDIFQLGNHRLLCGDSTSEQDVSVLMDGKLADMIFTDPPYNIAYEGGSKKREMIKNDEIDDFYGFLFKMYTCAFKNTRPGASIYVTHAEIERVNFTKAFVDAGFHLSSVIIWAKNNPTFGRKDYFWKHEPMLYGWNSDGAHSWYGPNNEDTVWQIDRPSRSEEHPTMKPIELIDRTLKNSSREGMLVLDLFGGSGSTLIACEKQNRDAYLMELDPHYCDVIIARFEAFSGKTAIKLN